MKELSLERMAEVNGGSHYASCVVGAGLQAAAVAGISGWISGGFWPALVMGGWIGGAVVGSIVCYGKY